MRTFKILVRFPGDNDFSSVMRRFGELLLMNWNEEALKPEVIARWFNNVASTLHEMASWDGTETCKRTADYLKITPADVFIDAAVDEKMKTYDSWGNHDSVLVTYDQHTDKKHVLVV